MVNKWLWTNLKLVCFLATCLNYVERIKEASARELYEWEREDKYVCLRLDSFTEGRISDYWYKCFDCGPCTVCSEAFVSKLQEMAVCVNVWVYVISLHFLPGYSQYLGKFGYKPLPHLVSNKIPVLYFLWLQVLSNPLNILCVRCKLHFWLQMFSYFLISTWFENNLAL